MVSLEFWNCQHVSLQPDQQYRGGRRNLLHEVINKVFNGSPRDLVATLHDTGAVTPEVTRELKRLIAATEGCQQWAQGER